MRWTLKRRKPRGTILGMSLLLLSLLTSLGAGLLNVALNAHTGARHDINAQRALAVAEAGISHARRLIAVELRTTPLSEPRGRLTGTKPAAPEVALSGFTDVENLGPAQGRYSVWVRNNLEPYKGPVYPADPVPAADTDNRIWIRSEGKYRAVSRTVRVLVDFTNLLDPPGAITLIDDGVTPDRATLNGNAFLVTGNDTPAPTTTGACGSLGTPKYGISVNSAGSLTALAKAVAGNQMDNITGTGGLGSYADNGSISRAQLQSVANALIPWAKKPSDKEFPGTADSPGIFVANSDIKLAGNGRGYGILIVTGNGTFEMTGTYQWEGLIIVLGAGSATITGTPNLYGALLVANTNGGATEVTVKGDGGVNYSSQALCRIQNMVPTSTVIAWQQVG